MQASLGVLVTMSFCYVWCTAMLGFSDVTVNKQHDVVEECMVLCFLFICYNIVDMAA